MSVHAVHGTTAVGLLYHTTTAPYFGRGAVKKMVMKEPEDYTKEFSLVSVEENADTKERTFNVLVTSRNRVIEAADFSEEERRASFARTKLPYAEHGINAEQYINLAAYRRLEIHMEGELDSKYADGLIEQEWSQLINTKEQKPVLAFPLNLVEEKLYVPFQIRREKCVAALREARDVHHMDVSEDSNEKEAVVKFVAEKVPDAFDFDIEKSFALLVEEDEKRLKEKENK